VKRIAVLGYGFIGSNLNKGIAERDDLEVVGIYNRDPWRLEELDSDLRIHDLKDVGGLDPDVVIEAAHPDITRQFGSKFLAFADYMPLSVTALADDDLFESLKRSAEINGNRMLIPHGALVGLDSLLEWRDHWKDVSVTFRKSPRNIDFSNVDVDASEIDGTTTLYDGPARGIAARYPRNVNTIITAALATVGLDRLRARLIADPGLDVAIAEVEAIGVDGSQLQTVRRQPAVGVSGTEMFASLFQSLKTATNDLNSVDFV
jgi:predicted dinucleotide-utilizing enzyme